jgi:hypothetical protein
VKKKKEMLMEQVQTNLKKGFIYIRYSKDRIRPWIVNFDSNDYFCYNLRMHGDFWGSQPVQRPGGEINGFGHIILNEDDDLIDVFSERKDNA